MRVKISGFDWNSGNWPKCGKHGVSKEEIEAVFQIAPSVMPDPHPEEPRMRAIGQTQSGRYIFLVFMFRIIDEQTYIRVVSARYMHKKEVAYYEKTKRSTHAIIKK